MTSDQDSNQDLRVCEALRGNEWIDVRMSELKPGERFRMFDPDGSPVVDNDNRCEWVVKGEPYRNENGIWTVVADG
jgi:hypothetical protein